MIIDIIIPKNQSYHTILKKTKKYYGTDILCDVISDNNKNYCITIQHKSIRFYVFNYNKTVNQTINNYIEYLFSNNYIGAIDEYGIINPKNVEVFKV